MGINAVIKHLIAVNKGDIRGDDTLHTCLERVFELHAMTEMETTSNAIEIKE